MYSRSVQVPEMKEGFKIMPVSSYKREPYRQIPVKSFTDTSAYEHFGNLGRRVEQSYEKEEQSTNSEHEINFHPCDNSEPCEIASAQEPGFSIAEENSPIEAEGLVKHKTQTTFTSFLSEYFDGIGLDSFLLIAVATLLFLQGFDEKNKIAPFALIFIALL